MLFKLGFIGLGVMGGAILERAVGAEVVKPSDVAAFDAVPEKRKAFSEKGINILSSAEEVLKNAEVVFLAVKPQNYRDIITGAEINAKCLVTIMAGVKIATLRDLLPENIGIARIMPNTPCSVGKGASAVCFDGVSAEHTIFIENILSAMGVYIRTAESNFDAVTSISGSGPAYVYMFINALTKAGIEGGLSPEDSKKLALMTVEGSAAYAAAADYDLDTLTDRVCSKGGTTIEAVEVFREKDLFGIVSAAVKACRDKSELLSKKL